MAGPESRRRKRRSGGPGGGCCYCTYCFAVAAVVVLLLSFLLNNYLCYVGVLDNCDEGKLGFLAYLFKENRLKLLLPAGMQ